MTKYVSRPAKWNHGSRQGRNFYLCPGIASVVSKMTHASISLDFMVSAGRVERQVEDVIDPILNSTYRVLQEL
jgi:hypothetical protein